MEQNRRHKVEWAGCSDLDNKKKELLKAHKEFLEMLSNGWQVKDVKPKRQRIKREKFKVIITCFGPMKITVEEFNAHCKDFRTL